MAVNFVKFQRGTFDAYQTLVNRNAVDTDTLYFIYNKDNPSDGGDLYLGYTLIGGTSSNSGSGVEVLSDLNDVRISSIQNFQILQYRSALGKWVNKSISEALSDAGITFGANVTVETAVAEGETVLSTLNAIANKREGDIAVIEGNPYVYDSTSGWISLTNTSVLNRISNLEDAIQALQTTIQTVRGEIDSKIAQANHLTYQVLDAGETLSDIDVTSPTIGRTVFLVPNNNSENGNSYYEYMYINGAFEKIGDWATDLSGYVTTSTFNTAVANIQNQLDGLSNTFVTVTKYNNEVGDIATLRTATGNNASTVIGELTTIHDRLQWHELSNS